MGFSSKLENITVIYSSETLIFNEEPCLIEGSGIQSRPVCAITFLNKDKKRVAGSGVLTSKDTLLTAASNIFDKENQAENTDFKIYVGEDGVGEEFYDVEDWKYPREFMTCSLS